MRLKFIFVMFFTLVGVSSLTFGQEVSNVPPDLQQYQWHYSETSNFEILSIDPQVGRQIESSVEAIKLWTHQRWGLKDTVFAKKCMILCVSDPALFKQWFHRDDNIDPKLAKSKNPNGTDRMVYGIWVSDTRLLPEKIARVCLLNYEDVYKVKFGLWAHVGMGALNNDVNTIRSLLSTLDPNESYTSKSLFEPSVDSSDANYKAKCAAMCLLLRKQQYASQRYTQFLATYSSTQSADQALQVFGFQNIDHFDVSFNAYARNLAWDIRANRTPNMGLTWFLPKAK